MEWEKWWGYAYLYARLWGGRPWATHWATVSACHFLRSDGRPRRWWTPAGASSDRRNPSSSLRPPPPPPPWGSSAQALNYPLNHSLTTHWAENQSRISNPIGSVLEVGGADACSSFNPVGKSQVFRGATARCGYLLGAERRGTCACCGGRRSTEGCRPRSLRFIVAPGVTGTGRYRQHGE